MKTLCCPRLFCICIALLYATASPVSAQSNLAPEVDRLSDEIDDIQTRLNAYEKRNPAQPVAALQAEIGAMREEISTLRGRVEQAEYEARQTSESLRRFEADVDARLALLEQQGSTGELGAIAPPVIGGADPFEPPVIEQPEPPAPIPPVAPVIAEAPTPEIETPPAEVDMPTQEPADVVLDEAADLTQQPAGLPDAPFKNANEQYNAAFTALNQGNYAESEQLFRDFTLRYPNSSLTGNAWYWLGESFYVRSRYEDAITQFRKGYQISPNGPKAPDNLLKLGMALARIGQPAEACTVFSELLGGFDQQPDIVRNTAIKESGKLNCPE